MFLVWKNKEITLNLKLWFDSVQQKCIDKNYNLLFISNCQIVDKNIFICLHYIKIVTNIVN